MDWRTRFHLPLSCIPEEMDWAEAWNLYELLSNDPSSYICAAQVGWEYPLSRSETVGIHQFDMINSALQGRSAKPYPKPWPDEEKTVYKGKTRRTDDEMKERLRLRREGQINT